MNKQTGVLAVAALFGVAIPFAVGAVTLSALTSEQWDTYTSDNTRFDGIYWKDGQCKETKDQRSETPASVARIYTHLSQFSTGRRGAMTAGYIDDTSYMCGQKKYHAGVDISAPSGTTVRAVLGGRVTLLGSNYVGIDADDGNHWVYVHLRNIKVTKNQRISPTQELGLTDGLNHLHLEVQNGHGYFKTDGAMAITDKNRKTLKDETMSPLEGFFRSNRILTASHNFSGTTLNGGVNARQAPFATTSPDNVSRRLPGNTRLEFDASAYGQTVTDSWTKGAESRWLRIAGTNEWVSSAVISGDNPPHTKPNP